MTNANDSLILNRIRLEKYGRFEDLELELGKRELVVVYGPNESGKSTLHQGFLNFLFGVKNKDLHSQFVDTDLKIIANLSLQNESYAFERNSGRRPLKDGEAKIVKEQPLEELLAHIDQSLYERLFTCDYLTLRKGGQELFAQGGELRETLFGASTGLPLKELLDSLKAEAENLYRKNGSREINKAADRYKEAKEQYKKISVNEREYVNHKKKVQELEQKRNHALSRSKELRELQSRYTRWHHAYDDVLDYLRFQDQLAELQHLPELSPQFAEEVTEIDKAEAELRLEERSNQERLESLQLTIAQQAPDENVLKHTGEITNLNKMTSQVESNNRSVPQLKSDLEKLSSDILALHNELCQHLPISSEITDPVHAPSPEEIRDLIGVRDKASDDQRNVARQIVDSEARLEELVAEEHVSHGVLVEDIKKLDDMVGECTRIFSELEELERRLAGKREQREEVFLKWKFNQKITREIPAGADIEQIVNALDVAEKELENVHQRRDDLEETINDLGHKITYLRRDKQVATEHDLADAKEQRDQKWHDLIETWQGELKSGKKSRGHTQVQSAFLTTVKQTDDIYDNLRENAQAMGELGLMEREVENLTMRRKALVKQLDVTKEKCDSLNSDWKGLFTGFTKSAPVRANTYAFFEQLEQVQLYDHEIAQGEARSAEIHKRLNNKLDELYKKVVELNKEISEPDEPRKFIKACEVIKNRLREAVGAAKQNEDSRKKEDQNLRSLKRTLKAKDDALKSAELNLTAHLNNFAWPNTCSPMLLMRLAEKAKEYNKKLTKRKELEHELRRKLEFNESFDGAVRRLAGSMLPSEKSNETLYLIEILNELANDHRARDATHRRAQEECTEVRQKQQELIRKKKKHQDEIAGLCARCNVDTFEEVRPIAAQVKQRADLAERYGTLKARLEKISDQSQQELAEFIDEARTYAVSEHTFNVKQIEQELEELERERGEITKALSSLDEEYKELREAGEAAKYAQDIEISKSETEDLVQEYLVRLLTVRLLQRLVQVHTTAQGRPVLSRASELFARLTNGAFSGITTDNLSESEEIIVGLRANSEHKVPTRMMSDGTCDQLFLSLRLASLEERFKSYRALPVFFDDAFITFDRERLTTALQVLGEFSAYTQVIYYTHDDTVREIARELDLSLLEIGPLRQ